MTFPVLVLKRLSLRKQIFRHYLQVADDGEDMRCRQVVKYKRALAFHLDQECAPKFPQVVGDERLGKAQCLDDAGNGLSAVSQKKEDAQPVLVRQAFRQKCGRSKAMTLRGVGPIGFGQRKTSGRFGWQSFIGRHDLKFFREVSIYKFSFISCRSDCQARDAYSPF